MKQENYRVALWGDENGIEEAQSEKLGISGGQISEGCIAGVTITSEEPCYGGIRLTGGTYQIQDLTVKLDGSGGDDFGGKGTGLVCAGNAKVTVDRYTADTRGVIRNAVVVTDDAEAVFTNADINCRCGTDEEQAIAEREVRGLPHVPWNLGLYGNNRATNLLGHGKVTYIDSKLRAEGWGVLSTDGPSAPEKYGEFSIELKTENCEVEIYGPSGYGSYAIGAGKNTFSNTRFKVPDYALIVANEFASANFVNGTSVDSGRFGVMWHQNQGGLLKIEDSVFHTAMATFLAKGCYPRIEVSRSRLVADNGIILQLMDMDDPGLRKDYMDVEAEPTVKDENHDVCAANYQNVIMFNTIEVKDCCTDLQASFSDMELKGDFYNAITNAASVGTIYEGGMPDMSAPPPEDMGPPPESAGGMPPMPDMKPSSNRPINLILHFTDVAYEGAISATQPKHHVSRISEQNRYELGMIDNTLAPAVNNGVIATFDGKSVWTVDKTCYLTALTIAPDASICAVAGKSLTMTVNGIPVEPKSGTYQGDIVMKIS